MSAFASAMSVLIADPNLGISAVWRAGGTGPDVSVRVLRSAPDRVAGAFDAAIVQATDVLTAAVADLPDLAPGDSFVVGAETLIVMYAERDAIGVAWRVFCRRPP